MDELRAIVQRMIETGRSEEEISTVVQNYQKEKGFTKNDFVQSTETNVTDDKSNEFEVYNIINSIDENNEDVKNIAAENYFSKEPYVVIDNVEYKGFQDYRDREGNLKKDKLAGTIFQPFTLLRTEKRADEETHVSKLRDDEKVYFEKRGIDYNDYLKFQKTGEFDLNLTSKENIEQAIKQEQNVQAQNYVRGIDDDKVRNEIQEDLQDDLYNVFDPNDKEDVKFKSLYKEALKKDRNIKGVAEIIEPSLIESIIADPLGLRKEVSREIKMKAGKNSGKVLSDYLTSKSQSLTTEISNLDKEFEKLGEVTKDSSQEKIQAYNDLIEKSNGIRSRLQKYTNNIEKIGDAETAIKAFGLEYNFFKNAQMNIDIAKADVIALSEALDSWSGLSSQKDFDDAISYSQSLREKKQVLHPLPMDYKDINMSNLGEAANSILSENIASLGPSLSYVGIAKLAAPTIVKKKGKDVLKKAIISKKTRDRAGLGLASLFFGLESGAELSELEIAQREARENLPKINAALEKVTDENERLELLKIKDDYDKSLSISEMNKAFSVISAGATASLMERLGTIGIINRMSQLSRRVGPNKFKNLMRKAGGSGFNAGVEYTEEYFTQVLHNIGDNVYLDENKSLSDGIDANFNMNVLFSALAIQGGAGSLQIPNVIRSEMSSYKERKANKERTEEIINLKSQLDDIQRDPKKSNLLAVPVRAKINELLKESAAQDALSFASMANMTDSEIREVLDNNKKIRDLLSQAAQEGSLNVLSKTDYSKRKLQEIKNEVNILIAKNEELRKKPEERNEITLSELFGKENVSVEDNFYYGQYKNYMRMVEALGESNNKYNKAIEVKTQEEAIEKLNSYLEKGDISIEKYEQAVQGIKDGANGVQIPSTNTALLISDNVANNIFNAPNNTFKAFFAYAPFHETQHQYDQKVGIVKGDNVVQEQKIAVESLLKHLEDRYNSKKINKEQYLSAKTRLGQYTNNNTNQVNLAELKPIFGEFINAGIIDKSNPTIMLDIKSLLNGVAKSIYKDDFWLFRMNNAEDVLAYIRSFQKQVTREKLQLESPPEEEQDVKKSLGIDTFEQINNLIPKDVKTKADFNKFFNDPTRNKELGKALAPGGLIDNVVKQKTVGDEYETTIDGVRDRVMNFNPEATRKDGSVVGPQGFAERIFSDTRFARMDARKALATKKPTVRLDDPDIKDIPDDTPTPTKKVEDKTKKTVVAKKLNVKSEVDKAIKKQLPKLDVKNLTFKKLKNLVPETTGRLFGISPKKLKTLANITKPELQKAQMYISKNADLLLAMLPEGTTISGTSTGVPNTLLKAFYTKTDRAKLSKTGSASGLPVQVKNKNITKKQFLEVFGIIDGKPTRDDRNTSARVLALANLTGKMMTNQAVRENLELLGDSKQTIKNIREGAADVMFSKGISNLGLINFKKLINDPKNGIDNYDLFLDKMELLASYFPDRFIRRVDLYSWGITNENTKLYAREKTKELKDVFLMGQHPSGRVYLKPNADNALGTSIKGITKAKVKKYNDSGKANFDIMINSIKKAVKNNPNDIELHSAIYVYLSNSVQDTTHPLRGGAEYIGGDITATGQIIYEHAVQSARARDIIMDALLDKNQNFDETIKALKSNYKLIAMSKKDADQLKVTYYINEKGDLISYENGMGVGWDLFNDKFFDRYFNLDVNFINPNNFKLTKNNKTFAEEYGVTMSGKSPIIKSNLKSAKVLNNAISSFRSAFEKFQAQKQRGKKFVKDLKTREKFEKFQAQKREAEKFVESIRPQIRQSKGITILDFDDTLATTKSLVKYTAPDGTTGTLNAEQFASTYQDLQEQGYKFDFSDFNKVVKGKLAPLFQKALKLQNKFGPENMFVLTARPPQSQKAIFDFLKANGLNIPLKNITGLGNSTAEAKALWVADKVAEGYNDFYFADDALQNVQAVKNMLDQFDVKSKIQQAKVNFSKGMDSDFNKILQDVTGIEFKKRFSDIKARKRGEKKGRFRFFVPPSHEDFVGLLYNFMGKGRKGDQHRDFFEKALVRPLNRAYREIDTAKQAIANDYKALNKQFSSIKKKLRKKTPDGDFIFEDAVRIYLWNKHGYEIPGLSPTDQTNLVELVNNDAELKAYADAINIISKQDTYVDPGKGWEGGNIKTDLIDATGRVGREQYFAEFKENADIIFSPENLNKIEAAYGKDFRSALEDMLHRISTGINRPKGQSGTINKFMNYLNGSVGTVMFFNVRSAILQQMSIVNYINFADNNIFAAAKAFANQKQYWKDFAFIFNSDMLKQRRGGIGTDINGADLAQAVQGSKDPTKVVISRLLQLGFLPTQIGDNIAIATGGATFYRNRVNKYIKDGLSQKEAEAKAFTDFQDLTQSTQQSSRPDMTSKQQASWIGKLVLNFQNITSQYNRIIKKAALDIKNGRISPPYTTRTQSNLGNLSKILYYGGIQNVIFYSLQTALFAVMFGDDEDEDQILKKRERVINGSIDSILRGAGIYGAVASTLKNTLIKFKEQREKGYNKDESAVLMELLNFSPVVGIKARQIVNAEKTINYNENIMSEMETFEAENPMWSAVTNYTQALTNFPANRLYQKSINMRNALDKDYTNFQRVMFFSGYTTWSLGLGDSERIIEIKEKNKLNKKNTKKSTKYKDFKFK